ncbi:hypothetical protein D3C79_1106270 [compost metagenome]
MHNASFAFLVPIQVVGEKIAVHKKALPKTHMPKILAANDKRAYAHLFDFLANS